MWSIDYTAETTDPPETVWRALRALESGEAPLSTGDRRHLDGPFAVGGTVSVTPVGLDTLTSTITELVENTILAEQTPFNGLVLLLRHTLEPTPGAGTTITRRLEITGDTADEQGPIAGPRISEDYPEALDEIIATARSRP